MGGSGIDPWEEAKRTPFAADPWGSDPGDECRCPQCLATTIIRALEELQEMRCPSTN